MPKTVSEAKLPMPRMAAPRAERLSPAATDSAASSTKSGRRRDADVLLEDRHQRPGLPKRGRLIDDDPAGLLAGGGRGVQFPHDPLGRDRREQEPLEHRHRQRRDVGQGLPVFGRRADVVEKAAVGGASRGHVAAKSRRIAVKRGVLLRLRPARIAARGSTPRPAARCPRRSCASPYPRRAAACPLFRDSSWATGQGTPRTAGTL